MYMYPYVYQGLQNKHIILGLNKIKIKKNPLLWRPLGDMRGFWAGCSKTAEIIL